MIDTSYIWKHWKPVHLSKAGTLLWKLHIYNSFYKCTYKYKIRHSTFIMWIYLCNIISWKNNSILKESCRNSSSRSLQMIWRNLFDQINSWIFFSEFVLYDLNRTVNEEIGREIFDYNRFPENQDNSIVISYKNVSRSMLYNTLGYTY